MDISEANEAYLKYKRNINKPNGMDIEWLVTDSDYYTHLLYEYGDLHVSMSHFTKVRDHVLMLWGSVLNWLDAQPAKKADELSEVVTATVKEMERKNEYDTALGAFSLSILSGKIGDTHRKDNGSFCYEALMAYKVFYNILCKIIVVYKIPQSEREMPLYPKYDAWVSAGILDDAYNDAKAELASSGIQFENNTPSIDAKAYIEELTTINESREPSLEAFRKKVTSECKVCMALDRANRSELAAKRRAEREDRKLEKRGARNAYQASFTERVYSIMVAIERENKTFKELADTFKTTVSAVRGSYQTAKRIQLRMYENEIKKHEYAMKSLPIPVNRLHTYFGGHKYATAYLEKKFDEILCDLRCGEPGSSYSVPEIIPEFMPLSVTKDVSKNYVLSDSDKLMYSREECRQNSWSYTLYRIALNEHESFVVHQKEEMGSSFEEIAEKLGITDDLARDIYRNAKTVQERRLLASIKEKTGKLIADLNSEVIDHVGYSA